MSTIFFFPWVHLTFRIVELSSKSSKNRDIKWTLSIDVSCYPDPGKVVITYVLCNIANIKVVQRKMNIPGRTTNNEEYYIALIEGLGTTREYGSNGIVVFTNSKLV